MLLRPVAASRIYAAVFGLLGWFVGLAPLADNSFFWHLRTGELILDSGIPRADPYSFLGGLGPWVAQSWIAEVLDALVERAFGPWGIRVLNGALCAATLATLYVVAARAARRPAAAAFLTVPAALCVAFTWSPRPLGIGLLLLVATVGLVEQPSPWLARHEWFVLPAVFWIWANVHGSFVLGFAYVGLHLLGRWLQGQPPWDDPERRLLVGAVAGFVLCFANPYGWRLMTFPLTPFGRREVFARIYEWQRPELKSGIGLSFLVVLVIAVGVMATARTATRRDFVVALPFLVAAIVAQRNIAAFAIVILPIAARLLRPREPVTPVTPVAPVALAGGRLVIAALVVFGGFVAVKQARSADLDFAEFPVDAYAAYERAGLEGSRLATTDRWAGWVVLEHWPDQEVFVDDRYDLYPPEVAADFFVLLDGGKRAEAVLDEYGIETVLWPRDSRLARRLANSEGWNEVYRDDEAVLFVRAPDAKGPPA